MIVVVGFITTYEISTKVVTSNPAHGKVYSIQHYVIKFLITTWICTYHKSVRSSRGDRMTVGVTDVVVIV